MTKVVIPPPQQPFVAGEKVNEPWRRHLDATNHALNSASQLIQTLSFTTTTSTGASCSIPSGWDTVRMDFVNLNVSSTAASLCVSVSTDNGTSFINSGYRWVRFTADDTTFSRTQSTSDGKFQIVTSLSTGFGIFGDAKLLAGSGISPRLFFRVTSLGSQTTGLFAFTDGGGRGDITAGRTNAILVHTTTGTFTNGTINFYGDR